MKHWACGIMYQNAGSWWLTCSWNAMNWQCLYNKKWSTCFSGVMVPVSGPWECYQAVMFLLGPIGASHSLWPHVCPVPSVPHLINMCSFITVKCQTQVTEGSHLSYCASGTAIAAPISPEHGKCKIMTSLHFFPCGIEQVALLACPAGWEHAHEQSPPRSQHALTC